MRCLTYVSLVMLLAVATSGCAKNGRLVSARHVPSEHIVFNPTWNGTVCASNTRADWPATIKHNQQQETFRYRETIFDRQGATHSSRDWYYRRFDAVREGSGYR